jgi:hypothetical protein
MLNELGFHKYAGILSKLTGKFRASFSGLDRRGPLDFVGKAGGGGMRRATDVKGIGQTLDSERMIARGADRRTVKAGFGKPQDRKYGFDAKYNSTRAGQWDGATQGRRKSSFGAPESRSNSSSYDFGYDSI